MSQSPLSTRDRIVAAAAQLFYKEGIHAVSVDAVAEKAQVTKRGLYYHFRSKDDLIAAYLQQRDQPNLETFKTWYAEKDGDLPTKIKAIFQNLAKAAGHPKWKGCGFLRTSVELVQTPGHPAIVAGRRHKKNVEDWLYILLSERHLPEDARLIARQIILLLDGAFSVVLLHRDPVYFESAGEAAAALVGAPS
ncbi:TetR family transcriptional regulator [Rhizobium sp. ERR 1071]|uniref:TetR/AcrR family transcriptional regulator n=1 Tax=Rhizobium sp. ERR 1071 TaxID=2572677 RepID=UPI00119B784E|nr:TetR/AcrR family transcriptional regulator [Rhizobium sp. ERR1071]TWB09549.1 TetR family transcriptional regulator [Rhizobium sp. ERR1071]